MGLSPDSKQHVDQVATESLHMLENVAKRAANDLQSKGVDFSAVAAVSTLTAALAMNRLGEINHANLESSQILAREPAIARVVVMDAEGQESVYYICRAAPVSGVPGLLASYKAPVGRLASLPVGEDFVLPGGKRVEIVERTRLRPTWLTDGWDSRDSIYETNDDGPLTIVSLRQLLREVVAPEQTCSARSSPPRVKAPTSSTASGAASSRRWACATNPCSTSTRMRSSACHWISAC